MMRRFALHLFFGLLVLSLLAACGEAEPELSQEFTAYDEVRFKLPEGWQLDRGQINTEVSGGYGYASPDYAGLTYLRLHQGAVFAVMGDWDLSENAATILQTAFADNISSPEYIEVLGLGGTYAHGQLEQGQGIGAVHLRYMDEGEERQYAFIVTVANTWAAYEDTFLAILQTLTWVEAPG
jgi:hypothetical protein